MALPWHHQKINAEAPLRDKFVTVVAARGSASSYFIYLPWWRTVKNILFSSHWTRRLFDSFNPKINNHCIDRVPSFLQRLCNIEGKSCVTHSWVHSKWWTQWSWVVSCTAGPHAPPNWTGEICSHRMTCTHPPHPDRRSWPANTDTHTHYRDILQIISSVIILPEKCFLWNPWKLFLSQKASLTWNNKEAQALIQ